jgi:hypothetical protein
VRARDVVEVWYRRKVSEELSTGPVRGSVRGERGEAGLFCATPRQQQLPHLGLRRSRSVPDRAPQRTTACNVHQLAPSQPISALIELHLSLVDAKR